MESMGRQLNKSTSYKWQHHARLHSGSSILSSHRHITRSVDSKTFGKINCTWVVSSRWIRYLLGVHTSIIGVCIMSGYALEGQNAQSWIVSDTADYEKDKKGLSCHIYTHFCMVSEYGEF